MPPTPEGKTWWHSSPSTRKLPFSLAETGATLHPALPDGEHFPRQFMEFGRVLCAACRHALSIQRPAHPIGLRDAGDPAVG